MLKNRKILITGAGAQLGIYLIRTAQAQSLSFQPFSSTELDITNTSGVAAAIEKCKPDIIINCAAYNLIDQAQLTPPPAFAVNTQAVEQLALLCRRYQIFLVHYSTAHVFDGNKRNLYTEGDTPHPVNIYGQSKWQGEEAIQKHLKNYLILRLSWVFGCGKNCFLTKVSQWANANPALRISSDEISIPMYSQDVVEATLLSLEKGLSGLYHLTSHDTCSRHEYVKQYLSNMGLNNEVVGVPAVSFGLPAQRPLYSGMSNKKIEQALKVTLPRWQDGLNRFTEQLKKGRF